MGNQPRILSLHISMAASYWQERFANGDQNAAEIQEQFQDMLRGIQAYLSYDYHRDDTHLRKVYRHGCVTIFKLASHMYGSGGPSLLLVPSLVNKAHIFDLTPERSMLRYLCAQGIDAYLLDWGDFLTDTEMQNMDDVVLQKMRNAVRYCAEEAGGEIHVLGYCMGGTLLAGLASLHGENICSLIFMAAPWDFHAGSQELLNRIKFWSPSLFTSLKEDGLMKVDWLQILFSSLYPEQAMKKFARFSMMDPESDDAHIFVAVEDWLNDGVPLPAALSQETVMGWFLNNDPINNKWTLGEDVVDVSRIQKPCFIVASSEDKLVEFGTANALHERIENSECLDPACGHVGMIAGRSAVEDVWAPIARWVLNKSL